MDYVTRTGVFIQSTQEFVTALSADAGIPASELVVSVKGGDPWQQGTWVHPDLAIKLAGWLNPHFEIQVIRWARAVMEGRSPINTHTDIQLVFRQFNARLMVPHIQ